MDDNGDTNKRKLARCLTQLGMQDLVKERIGKKLQEMHLIGKYQTDGIWSTKDIKCNLEIFCTWTGYTMGSKNF